MDFTNMKHMQKEGICVQSIKRPDLKAISKVSFVCFTLHGIVIYGK